jgi:hypothetical protein
MSPNRLEYMDGRGQKQGDLGPGPTAALPDRPGSQTGAHPIGSARWSIGRARTISARL